MPRFQLVVPALLLAACGGGSTVVEPPPPPADEFTLTLKADAEDANSAQALGWSAGIPETDVILTPKAPATGAPQTHRTSAAGKIVIAKLPAADYLVEARRMLTDAERSRLAAEDDAVGFVAKMTVRVAVGGGAEVVSAPASRRRSLVISEFFINFTYPADIPYFDGAYIELHNNSDSTIYLDGMVLARALSPSIDTPNFPCSLYTPFSHDPGGVWVRWMAKFPGTGRDYPILPGGTTVVATDAIEHSVIAVGGPDLRGADFEMIGIADVDNPSVPNMTDITEGGTLNPHGINWPEGSPVTVLTLPLNVPALRHSLVQQSGYEFVRVPREKIVDLLGFHTTYVGAYTNCPSMVHANFDRAMAFLFLGDEYALSGQRRTAVTLPDGRKVVQHSRSSDADFIAAPRSPGAIP